jgi:hypothetical protein
MGKLLRSDMDNTTKWIIGTIGGVTIALVLFLLQYSSIQGTRMGDKLVNLGERVATMEEKVNNLEEKVKKLEMR